MDTLVTITSYSILFVGQILHYTSILSFLLSPENTYSSLNKSPNK